MAGLVTVGDVVTEVRTLIQDTESDNFRYPDPVVYQAMNEGLLETKKLRPDFYRGSPVPQYDATNVNLTIAYPQEYLPALIDYTCGRIQLQDDEATSDARADAFLKSFVMKLTMAQA